jgi:hypothetical protein
VAADDAAFDITDNMTFSCWIKRESGLGVQATVASRWDGPSGKRAWLIWFDTDDTLYVWTSSTGSGSATFTKQYACSIDIADGTWHHFAWVFETTAITLYVDGQEDTSAVEDNNGASSNSIYASTESMYIGALTSSGTPATFFEGNLDEVAVWASAKTETDIADIYGTGRPTMLTGTASWWRMGECGCYPSLTDSSVNTNAMTMTNMSETSIVVDVP